MRDSKPRIVLITCGGTIACAPNADGMAAPRIAPAELLRGHDDLMEAGDIRVVDYGMYVSADLTLGHVVEIARQVEDAFRQGADGVVVAQGTDTMEEVAFGLDLLHQGDGPVVLTGATRHSGLPGADGPANLLASVRVAGSPEAQGLGVVVVMNDEIHAARYVQKTHTANPSTFQSPSFGPLGLISEGNPSIAFRPVRRVHVPSPSSTDLPQACLLKMSIGDDGRQLGGILAAGFAGLVIEAFGGGHLPAVIAESAALAELLRRVPVVLASRTGSGEVLRRTYGDTPGSESVLLARGVLSAGDLDGPKARVLLTLLLARGLSAAEIAPFFEHSGALAVSDELSLTHD